MIITDPKKQLEVLKQFYGHINRIEKQVLTKSDKLLKRSEHQVTDSNDKFENGLPKEITYVSGGCNPGWAAMFGASQESAGIIGHTIKTAKLKVLIDIYNKAATAVSEYKPIDLDLIFKEVKASYIEVGGDRTSIEELMHTHRRPSQRQHPGSIISTFFRPKSEKFLEQYEFFKPTQPK